jgi:small nuclear ribonucleoprotein
MRPFDALSENIEKEVLIVLKSKVQIRGKLKSFDVHVNVVLENAQEIDENGNTIRSFPRAFIRGDTILYVVL